ncbi:unnamed protein product [Amaranthus hypochondriacus]
MSLSLIQGYSSAEEDEHKQANSGFSDSEDESDTEQNNIASHFPATYKPIIPPKPSHDSSLPSAVDVFSEISGPPRFLNNCVEDQSLRRTDVVHQGRKKSRDRKDLPVGAVVEAKAHVTGIRERVRSDNEGNVTSTQPQKSPSMCLQCGIPKTYSTSTGWVCPQCSALGDSKNRGSTVKDKEKVKRMRGQSSHATWKSETEMHLRQQFD